jgi:uncharacterized protein YrrD
VRITELKGRPVVDPTTARKRGTVVDALINPSTGRLAAVEIVVPDSEARERIAAEHVARIGRDAVMLAPYHAPEPDNGARPGDGSLACAQLVGLEVLGENGDRIGSLRDAQVDPESLAIRAYELTSSTWRRWLGMRAEIRVDEVTSWSHELLLVKTQREVAAAIVDSETEPLRPPEHGRRSRAGRPRLDHGDAPADDAV